MLTPALYQCMLLLQAISCITCGYRLDSNREIQHLLVPRVQTPTLGTSASDDSQTHSHFHGFYLETADYVMWMIYTIITLGVVSLLAYCFRSTIWHLISTGVRGITDIELRVRITRENEVTELVVMGRGRHAPPIPTTSMTDELAIVDDTSTTVGTVSALVDSDSPSPEMQFHDCIDG